MKSAKGRDASSTRWLARQLNDPYVREAKAKGYRSRAAFKLIELDGKFQFLRNGATVLDLGAAHDTPVRSVQEFPNDPTRFQVGFWAYSPVCALTRDQPEFERIYTTLTQAVETAQMVWVVTHSQEVVEGEPDPDGLIPAYPRIMDVRPA